MIFVKSRNPVGRAFPDVWEAFSETFPHRNPLFQLAGLLPTFGECFSAPKRVENLGRQAPLRKGFPKGVPLRARFGVRFRSVRGHFHDMLENSVFGIAVSPSHGRK